MSERRLRIAIGTLATIGIAIAGYLTYVHYAHTQVFCLSGGSGGCETVQQSEQSHLLGIPVALLGLIGYVTILATAIARGEAAALAGALTAVTGFGFSAYLQYESLVVIDATCQWCVASFLVMTVLAVLTCLRVWRGPEAESGPGGAALEG